MYKYIGYIQIKLPVTCMLQCSYFSQLQPPLSLKHSRITLQQPSKPGILQGSSKSKWNVKMQFVRIGRFASIVEELHLEGLHQKVKKKHRVSHQTIHFTYLRMPILMESGCISNLQNTCRMFSTFGKLTYQPCRM